jgi:hypothetical protein
MRKKAAWIIGVMALFAISASAQSSSITGTVSDPSGKVIPGAGVKLTYELNGEVRSAVTDENGDFVFTALGAGAYTIRVESRGFRPMERKGNNVLAASRLALGSLQMDVGAVTETVSVTAQGAGVATTTTAHEAHLDNQQVAMISIRGRDPMAMLRILPGVQQGVDQDTFGGSFATAVPAILGQTGRQTIYVDGINGGDGGNGGGGGGNFSDATNLDAIAEVDVKVSNYTAEYGLKGGPQVNLITKHGGQAYRGTAYWYKRHEMFNATNFFNNAAVPRVQKPVYRYQTLGGNLGGPVKIPIPILNPGGKKMFFFYSLDDTRLKDAVILRKYTFPTVLERTGDFSQTRTTSGALVPVLDPSNNLVAFPNNVIPANRKNALASTLLDILPAPNALAAQQAGLGYNWINQEASIPHPRQQNILRVDLKPTDKDTISIKFQKWWTKSEGYEVAGASSRWGLVRTRYDFTSDDGKVDYTRIISPRMVNEFSIGIHYSTENGPPASADALAGMQRQNRGLASLRQIAPANNPLNIIPKASFGTLQNNSQQAADITYDGRWPITGADTSFPIRNDLTYTRGVHTFKFGALREHERFGQARSGNFGGTFDFSNDGNDPLRTGFAFSNAFIGHVTNYTEDMGRVPDNFYQSTWAFYAADSWKARRNLTIDIGMRVYRWGYPLWGGGEASAFSFDRFDPKWGGKPPIYYQPTTSNGRKAINPLTGEILPPAFIGLMLPGTGYSCGPVTPKTPCAINGIVVQNDPTYTSQGKGFYEGMPMLWDPRLGLAWDPFGDGKMAVRASFGVFHQGTGGQAVQGGGPAFKPTQTIRYTDMNSYFLGAGPTSPVSVSGFWKEGQKQPLTYNYTLAIQKDLGWHTILDVAYVGTTTHHIVQSWDFNALRAGVKFLPSSRDNTVAATPQNAGALPDNFLRPILGFGSINVSGPATTSRYDSLQVQANRRFARGFEIAGTYTYAGGTSNGWNQNNPLPSSAARSRLSVQQQVFNMSYVVDLPGGSKLLPGKVSKAVLDNWQVSGVSTFANGLPSDVSFSTSDSFDFSGGGETCGMVQTGDAKLARDRRSVDQWFNTSVFQRPSGRGDIGNNCNNAKFILPGFNNHDVSLFKSFHITEKKVLQFRAEAYNTLNHTQFNAVNTAAQFDAAGKQTATQFGKVTSARNERRMQMSLRFSF